MDVLARDYDESQHPRDDRGRWEDAGGEGTSAQAASTSKRPDAAARAAEDKKFETEKLITDGPNEGHSRVGIVKDRDAYLWGNSHTGSSAITGWSSKEMGIPGYRDLEPSTEAKALGDKFLDAIANGRLSEEPLYHGFNDRKRIDWKVGDTVRLPLTATSGDADNSASFGISYSRDDNSGATVFEFPRGTPMAGYARWDRNYTKDLGHTWQEAITAGGFKVTALRSMTESGYKQLPVKVVVLEPVELFDPATKQWRQGT
jgi:hypothetical protein